MGNWHCITSSCARVHYREYLPPQIRYRYENEDWQYVDGDDYIIDKPVGQCDTGYVVKGRHATNGLSYCGASWQTNPDFIGTWTFTVTGKVYGLKLIEQPPRTKYRVNSNGSCNIRETDGTTFQYFVYLDWEGRRKATDGGIIYFDQSFKGIFDSGLGVARIDSISRRDGLPDDCGNCILNIYKNGLLVHQETRMGCPEVEKLPCRLSDKRKIIEIKKLPYLERVEVVPYGYQNFGFGVYQAIIPNECLNIYNNLTTTIIPQFEGFPTPTNATQATYGFIEQICSPPGCPPPEYTVICDCECESCPPNTCAVNCDGHICCYDTTTGKSIKQIASSDYCGGTV